MNVRHWTRRLLIGPIIIPVHLVSVMSSSSSRPQLTVPSLLSGLLRVLPTVGGTRDFYS